MTRAPVHLAAALLACSFARPAAAAPAWTRLDTVNFVLVGDAGARPMLRVAARLEQFREIVASLLPRANLRSPVPTVVLVFASRKGYEPFKPLYQGKPVKGDGHFVANEEAAYVTLTLEAGEGVYPSVFHDYVHSILQDNLTSPPLWLSEGLAKYCQTLEVAADARRARIGRAEASDLLLLRQTPLVPLPELFAVDRASPLSNESDRRSIFHAESWALVHYLLEGNRTRRQQLAGFVDRLTEGLPPAAAFRAAFQSEPAVIERELRDYVRRSRFTTSVFTFSDNLAAEVTARSEPVTDAEAHAYLGDLLAHRDRPDAARTWIEGALKADANNARAHVALGRLHMRAGRADEALRLLTRAASLESDDPMVHLTLGLALARHLERSQAHGADRALVALARAALTRAGAVRPDTPGAFAALARLDLLESGPALDQARASLERAVQLAPARLQYRLMLAQVDVRQGDFQAARALLGPLLARSPDEETRSQARALMATLAAMEAESQRRSAAEAAAAAAERASAGAQAPAGLGGDAPIPVFRSVGDGETRAHGLLQAIECRRDAAVIVVKLAEGVLRLGVKRLDAVEFIAYREDAGDRVSCGPRAAPEAVYATYRPTTGPPSAFPFDGRAVAIEILPKNYAPQP